MTFPVWHSGSEESFWRAVERCLITFFAFDESRARRRVADFRVSLRKEKLQQPEVVFHDEPINLASDLAGKAVTLDDVSAKKYQKILQETA
jgi:hypothetical protein